MLIFRLRSLPYSFLLYFQPYRYFMNDLFFQVRILATDDGHPLRTSTATLTVLVDDINDNAPRLASPDQRPVVLEHVPPRKRIAELRAVDADDASRGNGPPFTWKLAEDVEPVIRASFAIEQDNSQSLIISPSTNISDTPISI